MLRNKEVQMWTLEDLVIFFVLKITEIILMVFLLICDFTGISHVSRALARWGIWVLLEDLDRKILFVLIFL